MHFKTEHYVILVIVLLVFVLIYMSNRKDKPKKNSESFLEEPFIDETVSNDTQSNDEELTDEQINKTLKSNLEKIFNDQNDVNLIYDYFIIRKTYSIEVSKNMLFEKYSGIYNITENVKFNQMFDEKFKNVMYVLLSARDPDFSNVNYRDFSLSDFLYIRAGLISTNDYKKYFNNKYTLSADPNNFELQPVGKPVVKNFYNLTSLSNLFHSYISEFYNPNDLSSEWNKLKETNTLVSKWNLIEPTPLYVTYSDGSKSFFGVIGKYINVQNGVNKNMCVICFRPSNLGKDWLANLQMTNFSNSMEIIYYLFDKSATSYNNVTKPYPLGNGQVIQAHENMATMAQSLQAPIMNYLQRADLWGQGLTKPEILVGGHSLGGGIAQLIGLYLNTSGFSSSVYTYNAPYVGNNSFYDVSLSILPKQYRFQMAEDIISEKSKVVFDVTRQIPYVYKAPIDMKVNPNKYCASPDNFVYCEKTVNSLFYPTTFQFFYSDTYYNNMSWTEYYALYVPLYYTNIYLEVIDLVKGFVEHAPDFVLSPQQQNKWKALVDKL